MWAWKITTFTPCARPSACKNAKSAHSRSCRIFAKYSWNDHPDTVQHSFATVMPGHIISAALASNHDTPTRRKRSTLLTLFLRFLRFLAIAEGPAAMLSFI